MPEPVLPRGGRRHMSRRYRRRAAQADYIRGMKKMGIDPRRQFNVADLTPTTLKAVFDLLSEVEARWGLTE